MLTVQQLTNILDEYPDDTPVGISVWNPIAKCYDGTEIQGASTVTTPGFLNYLMLETTDDLRQLAHEKAVKPKNKD